MNDIKVEQKGAITWITLNRPHAMNAVTPDMQQALQVAFDGFAADDTQHIAVLIGAGDKAFCAGSDLKTGPYEPYPKNGYAGLAERFDLHKPVIAAVNGFVLGGGFEIALACDLIIATETATFSLPEPLIGAVALGGGLHRLTRQIGLKQAMGLILTSKRIDVHEAHRLGLINEITTQDNLVATVERWCADILKGAPAAVRASKATSYQGLSEASLEDALANQKHYPAFKAWQNSEDVQEGLKSFAEKRAPKWTGR